MQTDTAEKQADRQRSRQRGRQTGREAGGQADRLAYLCSMTSRLNQARKMARAPASHCQWKEQVKRKGMENRSDVTYRLHSNAFWQSRK